MGGYHPGRTQACARPPNQTARTGLPALPGRLLPARSRRYISPSMMGSRPGALTVCAWASLVALGEEGLLAATDAIMRAALHFQQELVRQVRAGGDGLLLQGRVPWCLGPGSAAVQSAPLHAAAAPRPASEGARRPLKQGGAAGQMQGSFQGICWRQGVATVPTPARLAAAAGARAGAGGAAAHVRGGLQAPPAAQDQRLPAQ